MSRRIKSPLVLGALIVLSLSVGVAGAAKLITGKDIKDHSITGKDIKKGSLPLSVLKGKLPAGQQARKAKRESSEQRARPVPRAPRRSPKSPRWAARSPPRSLRAARLPSWANRRKSPSSAETRGLSRRR